MRPLLPGRAVLLPAVVVARLPADDTRSGGGIPRLLPRQTGNPRKMP